jgi:hypothetical protein
VIDEYGAVSGTRISSGKRSILKIPVPVSIYIEIFGIYIAILSRPAFEMKTRRRYLYKRILRRKEHL